MQTQKRTQFPDQSRIESMELPLRFPERVRELLGLDFRSHQWSDLVDALRPAAKELEYDSVWDCMRAMLSEDVGERQLEVLARYLTVVETYFFREKAVFDVLEQKLLPQLIAARERSGERRLRIWSAGCSTGEEVYSIAISLHRVLGSYHNWDVSILGTDINSDALAVATVGEYRSWSFRDLTPEILDSYFMRHPIGTYQIEQHIRQHVHFRRVNLADDWQHVENPALRDFDIIMCRNVLIYMEDNLVQHILAGFERALRPDGVFIPSLTEATLIGKDIFTRTRYGLITVYPPRQDIPTAAEPAQEAEPARQPADEQAQGAVPAPDTTPEAESGVPECSAPPPRPLAEIPAESHDVVHRARALADAGQLADAADQLRTAVDERPTDLARRVLLAQILREMGEEQAAEREFQRCVYLDGECIPAHFGLGSIYRKRGDMARSRLYLANALRLLQEAPLDDTVPDCGVTGRQMSEIIRGMM